MQINNEKITKEFCKGKILLFYPETKEEAAFIQRKILEMGFKWGDGSSTVGALDECVAHGILLNEDSELFYSPNSTRRKEGLHCRSNQLDENYLSPDQAFVLELFNKLSARLDKLEEYLKPQKLDKPTLKN